MPDETAFDVCKPCGLQVWGENMYDAIVSNMEKARDKGDLYQGSVTEQPTREDHGPPKGIPAPRDFHPPTPVQQSPTDFQPPTVNLEASGGLTMVEEAIAQLEEEKKPEPTPNNPVEPNPSAEPQPEPQADSTSTLDGLQETELSIQAEDLVEETPFIVETSKTGF